MGHEQVEGSAGVRQHRLSYHPKIHAFPRQMKRDNERFPCTKYESLTEEHGTVDLVPSPG